VTDPSPAPPVPRFERALVLGATGMIGAHAVRACLRASVPVRALVRPGSDTRNLVGVEVETGSGDLHDAASLRPALDGCDLVIHAAAPYPTHHFGRRALFARARAGLENLLAATAAAGVQRMVYVSSATTIGVPEGPDGQPAPGSRAARESDTRFPIRDGAPYFGLKAMMEEMVLAEAARGLPVVVVNPTFCVDEFDARRTTAQLMLPLAKRQIPAYLPGQVNAVATRDVGTGIVLAAQRGQVGQRYILGGENMSSRAFLERCARTAGVPAPRWAMPLGLAESISMATEIIAAATRARPLFPLTGIRMAKHGQAYDITLARRELSYEPSPVDAAIMRAYAWYRAQGWL
jgi:dihydroflavonol-4-reductase